MVLAVRVVLSVVEVEEVVENVRGWRRSIFGRRGRSFGRRGSGEPVGIGRTVPALLMCALMKYDGSWKSYMYDSFESRR